MTDGQWLHAGNVMLVIMTISYISTFILLLWLRPRDAYEWSIVGKIGTMSLVLLNGVAVIWFDVGANTPVRVVIFAIATIANVIFAVASWVVAKQRRS